ncbi:MAG: arginyltransferase [Rectinema sp.]
MTVPSIPDAASDPPETIVGDIAPCPYLEGRFSRLLFTAAARLDLETQESMIGGGWRRSGDVLYRPVCPGCRACIPLRLDAASSAADGRRKRAQVRNRGIRPVTVESRFTEEHFALYERYMESRHGAAKGSVDREGYTATLLSHPHLPGPNDGASPLVMEYRTAVGDRLVAIGWLDAYPHGLSSVYFAFDPSQSRRSLGVFSVAAEAAAAFAAGKRYYYLGFWVPSSRTMDYKADFRPFELALPDIGSGGCTGRRWIPFADRNAALQSEALCAFLPGRRVDSARPTC